MNRRSTFLAAMLIALAASGPASAIGYRYKHPVPGPSVSVRVELFDGGKQIIDQFVTGTVRRTGEIELEHRWFEAGTCADGSRALVGMARQYYVELGLNSRTPEVEGVLMRVEVRRSTFEQAGYPSDNCRGRPRESYTDVVEQVVHLKPGQPLDLPVHDGLSARLTMQ